MRPLPPTVEILEARIAPATFLVTNTNDFGPGSLRAALANADAQAGLDAIVFHLPASPLHSENVILLTTGPLTSKGNVTITGPGAGRLIIDGGGAGSVLNISDTVDAVDSPVAISGISFMHAGGVDSSGIFSRESLILKKTIVSGNNGDLGGGISVFGNVAAGTRVNISDSFITGNRGEYAGGMLLSGLRTLTISRTVVSGNASSGLSGQSYFGVGGILAITDSATKNSVAISGSVISGNTGLIGGGLALASSDPSLTATAIISGTKITGNVSTASTAPDGKTGSAPGGGGIFLSNINAEITGSTIRGNTAVYSGGGIGAISATSLKISKSTISGNLTTSKGLYGGGAGIFLAGTDGTQRSVQITESNISNNISARDGGGIYAHDGLALTISSSTISGNRAAGSGGGLLSTGFGANKVNLSVRGSSFSANVADTALIGAGGAISAAGDGTVFIATTKITGNVAAIAGGGIYASSSVSVNVRAVTASANIADAGGALNIRNTPSFQVIGGALTSNSADVGGGIYALGSAGSILGVTISGNAAKTKGGGVAGVGTSRVTLDLAKVGGNTAPTAANTSGTFATIGRAPAAPLAGRGTFVVTTVQDVMDGGTPASPLGPDGKLSLREALALADVDPTKVDTIAFALPAADYVDGAWTIKLNGTTFSSQGNVRILGPGAGKLILDGNNASGILIVSDGATGSDKPAVITGLSAANGNSGGIFSQESLVLQNVVVSGNVSTNFGGGVGVFGNLSGPSETKLVINNALITRNSANSFGGGVLLFGGKAGTISNTVVTGNTATGGYGGGITATTVATGTGIAISGSLISGNRADGGGGLFLGASSGGIASKVTISGTQVSGNASTLADANAGGGGIFLSAGNAVITGSVIQNNSAAFRGGGVEASFLNSLTIASSRISGNQTTDTDAFYQGGGGVFIDGGGTAAIKSARILNSVLADNRTVREGGGLLATGGVNLTISGSAFVGNEGTFGGGMRASGTGAEKVNLTIATSTFADNRATADGGGIDIDGDAVNLITSTKVLNNIATGLGGGLFARSTAAANGVTLKGLTVTGNFSTTNNGGGIEFLETPAVRILDSIITGNGGRNGGGVTLEGSGGLIVRTLITGNIASVSGGGIFHTGPSVILQIAKVVANSAIADPDVSGAFTFV